MVISVYNKLVRDNIPTILNEKQWTIEQVIAIQQQKRQQKGAFTQRIILEETTE